MDHIEISTRSDIPEPKGFLDSHFDFAVSDTEIFTVDRIFCLVEKYDIYSSGTTKDHHRISEILTE
jgi:hypothetical protein